LDVNSLLIGIIIGYIGSLVVCYIDHTLRQRDLQTFFLNYAGLELIDDEEGER
jgi:xanthine/uracil permease